MKLTALFTAWILALTLTGCTISPGESAIYAPETGNNAAATQSETPFTREEAIAAALNQAGLSKSDVWDLDAELDREWGKSVWEVDFDSGTQEYSFVLDAKTGELLHQKIERD